MHVHERVGGRMRRRRLTNAFAVGTEVRCEGACEEDFACAWLAVEKDIVGWNETEVQKNFGAEK